MSKYKEESKNRMEEDRHGQKLYCSTEIDRMKFREGGGGGGRDTVRRFYVASTTVSRGSDVCHTTLVCF